MSHPSQGFWAPYEMRPRKAKHLVSGKKKAHKHKLFGPVALGTIPGMSLGQNQGFLLLFSLRKPGIVPGTNPVCFWDNPGDEGRHKKFLC